jgi:hypothetical protein
MKLQGLFAGRDTVRSRNYPAAAHNNRGKGRMTLQGPETIASSHNSRGWVRTVARVSREGRVE